MKLTTTLMGILSVFSMAWAQFPGCPSINAGSDQTLTCNQPCATLNATPFHAGATTTYAVGSIPHTPPIAYNQAEEQGSPLVLMMSGVHKLHCHLPFVITDNRIPHVRLDQTDRLSSGPMLRQVNLGLLVLHALQPV
ncbi:hypothetical protein [Fluviicola sp.]|uniref:hypothetical protein n=1 Tax=Fluviicola sp. TaxID=1917219 RepID=UPI003D2A5A2A